MSDEQTNNRWRRAQKPADDERGRAEKIQPPRKPINWGGGEPVFESLVNQLPENVGQSERRKRTSFTSLSAYAEVFPVVVYSLQVLFSCRRNPKNIDCIYLIDKTIDSLVSVITSLADGYNRYHSEDKAGLYVSARSSLSNAEALLLLLGALGVLEQQQSSTLTLELENTVGVFNGLIRKMEDKT